MTALGLVETKGLLAAIEGADAMLKAADVRLLEKNLAGGGLVTITIAGEVSAVQAAVSAAMAAIQRIPGSVLVSHHVIARPDVELSNIIVTQVQSPAPAPKAATAKPVPALAVKTEPAQAPKAQTPAPAPKVEASKATIAPVAPSKPAAPKKSGGKKSSKKK